MNKLSAKIEDLECEGHLTLIQLRVSSGISLRSITLQTPSRFPKWSKGESVHVIFKETEVSFSTQGQLPISLQNEIPGSILSIEKSKLLCRITLQTSIGDIVGIISTRATESLSLTVGQRAYAYIKLNEVIIE